VLATPIKLGALSGFAVADGHMIVAVGNDSQFRAYCKAIHREDLAQDPRFVTNPQRVRNREQLVPILAEIMQVSLCSIG